MESSTRKISKEEWDIHKDTMKSLYYGEKLQLHSIKEERRTVMKVMKYRHGFSASKAQYEHKFQQWKWGKNVDKREWEQLFWQEEDLRRHGREARIIIAGSVASASTKKRARRCHEPIHHIGYTIPPERQIYVEGRDGNGPWSKYVDSENVQHTDSLANSVLQDIGAQGNDNITGPTTAPGLSVQNTQAGMSERNDVQMEFSLTPVARQLSPDFLRRYDWLSPRNTPLEAFQWDVQHSSSPWEYQDMEDTAYGTQFISEFPIDDICMNNSMHDDPLAWTETWALQRGFENSRLEQEQHDITNANSPEPSFSSQEIQLYPKSLAGVLIQCAKQTLRDHAAIFRGTDLPEVERVVENLEDLLPESIYPETTIPDSRILLNNSRSGPGLKALLYSISNNFAGLRGIPRSSIFKLIRRDQQIQSHLMDILSKSPNYLAKTLADNFFRAALESCDPQAVAMIMNVTGNNPDIAIDPNNFPCEFEGRKYTPIELAAKFRSIEVVQALLTAQADPNKTYRNKRSSESGECGALELAVRKWGYYEKVDLKLVRLLLECGAEVRIGLLKAAVQWGIDDIELLQLLLNQYSAARHSTIFTDILNMLVANLNNEAATPIVKDVFEVCKSTNCGKCVSGHPLLIQDMFEAAALRGNLELVEFLLPHTKERQHALAAAVRSGKSQVIDILLENCASVHGSPNYVLRRFTTPLAEAIRAQDNSLVREFEKRGALACVTQIAHFQAAAAAAAETGNVPYLLKIIALAPTSHRRDLTKALRLAIGNGHTAAALILLDAGACIDDEGHGKGRLLFEALKCRNHQVVDIILESEFLGGPFEKYPFMEAAVRWGRLDVIDDLASMGADLNAGKEATPLTAAIMNRDKRLVEHLLWLGANADARPPGGSSPLTEALKSGDHDIMITLLSHGASVTDQDAFLWAAEHDLEAYNVLLSAFEHLPLTKRRNFGGHLLMHFITKNDPEAAERLIKLGMNINKVCPGQGRRGKISALGFAVKYKKDTKHALVRKLLEAGGDPNSIAAEKDLGHLETPLILAIQTRDQKMVEILIETGSAVDRPARRGIKRTPLQAACEMGTFNIVKLLLIKGARVNEPAAIRGGCTALQLAAINGSMKIVDLLLDNGADPHGAPSKFKATTYSAISKSIAGDIRGQTAFEGAAENGRLAVLQRLHIATAAKPFGQEELGRAKGYAAENGHRGCVDYIDLMIQDKTIDIGSMIDFGLS